MTGKALVSKRVMDGASASSGSLLRTEFTTRSTSTGIRVELAALVNCTEMRETPSEEVDTIVSMLGSAKTASSIGFVTCVSMVAGSAPGTVVMIVTPGKLMLGKMPTPMVRYE